MSNPIFSFFITARKGKDTAGSTTQVYSCTTIREAKKVAIVIARAKWPEGKGWTNHTIKRINA